MASSGSPFLCIRCARMLRISLHASTRRTLSTAITKKPRKEKDSRELPDSSKQSSRWPLTQKPRGEAELDRPADEAPGDVPRWKQTPPAMKMPFRLRPMPKQPEWRVNDQPGPLDEMYDRFIAIGKGESTRGRDMLPEEIKWLAVTHKSFDHGRRGFNDRLAFLGKRIVDLQTSMTLLNAPPAPGLQPFGKDVYKHPALEGLENVTTFAKQHVLARTQLAKLASSYGIDAVVRWKPKKSDNLQGSGVDTVLAHTIYSIVGALALQRGGEVAAQTVKERILQPLGLK